MPENQAIADASPALARLLSPLGERVVFPPDIRAMLYSPVEGIAGCFALLELDPATGLRAGDIRRHLLDCHDTGVIAIGESHLRLAFCSVGKSALPKLVERLGKGVAELAAQRSDQAPKVTSALAPTKR